MFVSGCQWSVGDSMDYSVTTGQMFVNLYEKLCAGSLKLFKQFAGQLGHMHLAAMFVGPAKDAVDSTLPVDKVCSLDLLLDCTVTTLNTMYTPSSLSLSLLHTHQDK